jgi:ABC-type glutathione transport system ATPase component
MKSVTWQGSSDDYSDQSALMGGSTKSYGTDQLEAAISIEDRLNYTWKEIDVYGEQPQEGSTWTRLRKKFLNCFSSGGKEFILRKHLLKNMTGVAYSGELLAVMGASGAGKTTLLNALSFRSPPGVKVRTKNEKFVESQPQKSISDLTDIRSCFEWCSG